jgi:hypothetical protein
VAACFKSYGFLWLTNEKDKKARREFAIVTVSPVARRVIPTIKCRR